MMIIMSGIDSEINSYKEEIKKFKQEIKTENEKRFSFKCDYIALNQSREKENRIKIDILDLENKINKLESKKRGLRLKGKLNRRLKERGLRLKGKLNRRLKEREKICYIKNCV